MLAAHAHTPLFFLICAATPELYTLSLHDALPISVGPVQHEGHRGLPGASPELTPGVDRAEQAFDLDRKSTRLNSSHTVISYAVFCLKKKNRGVYELAERATAGYEGARETVAHFLI